MSLTNQTEKEFRLIPKKKFPTFDFMDMYNVESTCELNCESGRWTIDKFVK